MNILAPFLQLCAPFSAAMAFGPETCMYVCMFSEIYMWT
jgi:hypothetical protein